MKRFFNIFKDSFNELTGKNKVMCIVITGLMIAVSMIIEMFTIEMPFAKINFAYLAIAAIGMLYGPVISFFAGGICDVLGYIVHPVGAFIPTYIFIAMLQGLIYGIVLYRKWGNVSESLLKSKRKITGFTIRLVAARFLDVIIINLCLNTITNMHYGFIPRQALGAAIAARLTKNLIQFAVDLPLMIVVLPALLIAFNQVMTRSNSKNTV